MGRPAADFRVLIVRLSHIGDCLLTIPLATALRDAFPRATIGWAVEPPSDRLLACVPEIDEVVALPRKWSRSPSGWLQAKRLVRSFAADVAIDPQSLTKSAAMAWSSGASKRIGLARPEGRELAPWLATDLVTARKPHLVDRTLDLLQALDVIPGAPRWNLVLPEKDRSFADKLIREEDLTSAFAVINPGGTWPAKRWPPERFADVAKHLFHARGLRSVVVWAGDEERGWASSIAECAAGAALLAPKTSLTELGALLARAAFYLGGDSGPMHLAQAVGAPCVALFGPTLPERCGPYGAGHVALQRYYQAGSCRERRRASNDALRAIGVDEVSQACEKVLDDREKAGRQAA